MESGTMMGGERKMKRGGERQEDRFTDILADGEKSRDIKRQTPADGEKGGSRDADRGRDRHRETLAQENAET